LESSGPSTWTQIALSVLVATLQKHSHNQCFLTNVLCIEYVLSILLLVLTVRYSFIARRGREQHELTREQIDLNENNVQRFWEQVQTSASTTLATRGGGMPPSINQFQCVIKNSSTSWPSLCSRGCIFVTWVGYHCLSEYHG